MMTVPNSIPDTLAALDAAGPGLSEEDAGALFEASLKSPAIARIIESFNVLKGIAELPDAELKALAGCAFLIAQNAWYGLAGEAATVLISRGAAIAALPQPEPSVPFVPPSPPEDEAA
jgi:hypothetical protein